MPNETDVVRGIGGRSPYPISQGQFPLEYWKQGPGGDPDNKQTYAVETGLPGTAVERHEIEPTWDTPVVFD